MTTTTHTLIRTLGDGDLLIQTAAGNRITVEPAALAQAEMVELDIDADIARALEMLRAQPITDLGAVVDALTSEWATDEETEADWRDYASAVVVAAASPDVVTGSRCECGEWSGSRCDCVTADLVTVEFMPEQHRASHEAAGNRGSYPGNGAQRIRVSRECAAQMLADDGEWCEMVGAQ
jgi:hypothetical protein